MGSAASADFAVSATRIQWMWNSSEDPFSKSEPIDWVPYCDIENMIIEKAYTANKSYAMLDGYHIDFKHSVQISNNDEKQTTSCEANGTKQKRSSGTRTAIYIYAY